MRRIDGHDFGEIGAALAFAQKSSKPTIIACRTIIGFGAPSKAGTAGTHGSPLGGAEAEAAKQALGWQHLPFTVPEAVAAPWREAGGRGAAARRGWLKRLAKHPAKAEFERAMAGKLPEGWVEAMSAYKAEIAESKPKLATRQASQKALEVLVPAVPELVGGSADLTGSVLTLVKTMAAAQAENFAARYIYYGVREHGMAAAMNGIALHGGLIPYGGTFFVFSDYMRPSIRLAAIMGIRVIHVLTHDSIGLGEDGPTHQPVEQLASLRAMPNLLVLRPADAMETAECWELAVRSIAGPSLLVLSRQAVPALRARPMAINRARGAYVLAEAEGPRRRPSSPPAPRWRWRWRRGPRWRKTASRGGGVGAELRAVRPAGRALPRAGAGRGAAHRRRGGQRLRLGALAGAGGVFIGMSGFGASAPGETCMSISALPEAPRSAPRLHTKAGV